MAQGRTILGMGQERRKMVGKEDDVRKWQREGGQWQEIGQEERTMAGKDGNGRK